MLHHIAKLALGVALICAAPPAQAQMSISDGTTTTTTKGVEPAPGLPAPPAMPAANEPVASGQMRTVTSVKSCLDKLPPEDAAEIRLRYSRPYQECQRRLHSQTLQNAKPATAEEIQNPVAAENPRNFIRVKKSTTPPAAPILGVKGTNIREKSEKKTNQF